MPLLPTQESVPLLPEPMFATIERLASQLACDCWVVGGYVRDALLGRTALDVDLITRQEPDRLGRALSRELGGHYVVLDEGFGIGRVAFDDGRVIDLARLQADTLEGDLTNRDLTLNAIAQPLVLDGGIVSEPRLIDPTGGLADLAAGRIRAVSLENLLADPARLVRIFRFAATLDFSIDFETLEWVATFKRKLLDVASERTSAELFKILDLPSSAAWVDRLFGMGVLGVLLPEILMLARLKADADRTLDGSARALETLHRLEGILNASPDDATLRQLEGSLGGGANRRVVLKLAALLHEVGKPFCMTYDADGKRTFEASDEEGAERVEAIAMRMKFSAKARDFLVKLVGQQGRWEAVVQAPEDPVQLYRFFKATQDAAPALLFLGLASRYASQIPGPVGLPEAERAIPKILAAYFRPDRAFTAPERLVDGRALMQALGLKPGKQVGVLLEEVLEAQLRGEFHSQVEAIAWAGRKLQG